VNWVDESWKADRIGSAMAGNNPTIMAPLPASFAAIGDVQFLPGYSVLLSVTRADRLLDLPREQRQQFLADMDLLGEAVHTVCNYFDPGFRRINYEIYGNQDAILHAHIWPRYDWEPERYRFSPVGLYPQKTWTDPDAQLGPQHQALRNRLTRVVANLAAAPRPEEQAFARGPSTDVSDARTSFKPATRMRRPRKRR
jgi:diadenosine tetraphosphate (Ap4A) HIT family hydrolase